MSKALVIKGANFAANKVTTVELDDVVPCTGVTLSQNSITFSSIGATVQLTATKAPVDTTETLIWTSSDPLIASVANGLVTCNGVGTFTITATCGSQSAVCSGTASVAVNANTAYLSANGIRYSGSYEAPDKDYAAISSLARARTYYTDTVPQSGYHAVTDANYDYIYGIPIPHGTETITIALASDFVSVGYAMLDDTNHQTYVDNADDAAKCVGAVFYNENSSARTIDLTDYPNANSFILSVYAQSGVDISTVTGSVTVTFS